VNDIDFDELDRAVSSTLTPPAVTDAPSLPDPVAAPSTMSPAARRGGRFMDVVHPSSDMRGASTPTPRPASLAVPARPPAVVEPIEPSAWPDPIDVPNGPAPLESPFLADAKVEKRPLGGSDQPLEPVIDFQVETEPQPEPEIMPEPIAELTPEPILEPAPKPAPEPEPEPAPYVTETVDATPVGDGLPTSITQQYTEQPSTTEQPSGAIFDTEAYHQALVPPQKKKSGLLVVLWIVGLIILGAGLGAVMYFFVLPLI